MGTVLTYITREKDTLLDVARKFDLGYTQLMIANRGIDPWLPGSRKTIIIPSYYILPEVSRRGIVVNLAWHRLFYFHKDGSIETFPIGTGDEGRTTPIGTTSIVQKRRNPTWTPTPDMRKRDPELPHSVPPGPLNPLGNFALRLGWQDYLIHGTNKPYGVGRNVSSGCIRLYPEDIAQLFGQVSIGTPVTVIREDVAVTWIGDNIVVQIYPNKTQALEFESEDSFAPEMPLDLFGRVIAVALEHGGKINWDAVKQAGLERTGLPVVVGDRKTQDPQPTN